MVRPIIVLACAAALSASFVAAQDPPQIPPSQPRQPAAGDLSPAEVQRLFDAYALVQAQEVLELTDGQYAKFVAAMKSLQETRRRNQQERTRMLRELARMAGPKAPAGDDEGIMAAIATLKQQDGRAALDLQKAYDVVDGALTVRQRARFRLFEEQMERRKIELLLRARQPRRDSPVRDRGR